MRLFCALTARVERGQLNIYLRVIDKRLKSVEIFFENGSVICDPRIIGEIWASLLIERVQPRFLKGHFTRYLMYNIVLLPRTASGAHRILFPSVFYNIIVIW